MQHSMKSKNMSTSSTEGNFHKYHTRKCDICQFSVYQIDSAYLCNLCDECIHAAELNLQGTFHQQVPVALSSTLCHGSTTTDFNELMVHKSNMEIGKDVSEGWFVDFDNEQYLNNEIDELMNLAGQNTFSEYTYNQNPPYEFQHWINASDSAVPVQSTEVNDQQQEQKNQELYVALEHEQAKGYLNCTASSKPNIRAFCLDNGIVPEATRNISYGKPQEEIIDSVMHLQMTRTNREAKILRYREKKKARKFDKKIRYPSRKASADIRARVNGKFAKITKIENEQRQIFSTEELGYLW